MKKKFLALFTAMACLAATQLYAQDTAAKAEKATCTKEQKCEAKKTACEKCKCEKCTCKAAKDCKKTCTKAADKAACTKAADKAACTKAAK